MEKVAVSACLLGKNCKYNGGNNLNEKVVEFLSGKEVLPICPEILAGLCIPRQPCEIFHGKVISRKGEDLDEAFRRGAENALAKVKDFGATRVILQPRSPSCGVKMIYDGTFNSKLIKGMGVFAALLVKNGITVIDAQDIENASLVRKGKKSENGI